MSKEASALARELKAIRSDIAALREEMRGKDAPRVNPSIYADKYTVMLDIRREENGGFKAIGRDMSAEWPPKGFPIGDGRGVIAIGPDPYSALEEFSRTLRRLQMLHVSGHSVLPPRPSGLRPEGQ